jgi:hypothetical protein
VRSIEEWRERVHFDLYGGETSKGIIREIHTYLDIQAARDIQQQRHNSLAMVIIGIAGTLIMLAALFAPWLHSAMSKGHP